MNQKNWPYTNAVDPAIYASRTAWPKISIVTPSFNQGQFIEETILSILNQNYPNLEYIIIDGGSTDNTVDIIKKYQDRITYWVSEKDNGQADAINKGLEKCTGEIFNWINSDDYLEHMALYHIADAETNNYYDLICGDVINFTLNDNYAQKLELQENKNLSIRAFFSNQADHWWHQPGVWFKLDQLKKIGKVNSALHYVFDLELTLKYLYQYPKCLYLKIPLVYFRLHETSKTVSLPKEFVKEIEYVYEIFLHHIRNDKILFRHVYNFVKMREWHHWLSQTTVSKQSRFRILRAIFSRMLANPKYRISRFTFGAIKKVLTSQSD